MSGPVAVSPQTQWITQIGRVALTVPEAHKKSEAMTNVDC